MNRTIALRTSAFLKTLDKLMALSDVSEIRTRIRLIRSQVIRHSHQAHSTKVSDRIQVSEHYIVGELNQIHDSQTIGRARYYLSRLYKALTSEKTSRVNDLNLRRWKEYGEVWTDSLWMIPHRDGSGSHSAWYWGNFVPQIPRQLMLRYTKKDEWVLDPFAGSGTTLLECQQLGRNGLGAELNPTVAKKSKALLMKSRKAVTVGIEHADSTKADFRRLLASIGGKSAQLVILHPPYHDIIRFSRNHRDLSNAGSTKRFLSLLGKVVDNSIKVLDKGRFVALVIGDKYSRREWIPLGFMAMNEVLKRKCRLKSIIVKNFDQTAGKRKQEALWRYRALAGGFYLFKHEYIFIFQKD